MKKILCILLGLVLSVSTICAQYNLLTLDIPVLSTKRQILKWIPENISYLEEPINGYDNWQTPEETLHLRTGDCEDYVIIAMYLLDLIDIQSACLIIDIGLKADNGYPLAHALLKIGDKVYEPQNNSRVRDKNLIVIDTIYFERIMLYAYFTDNKRGK